MKQKRQLIDHWVASRGPFLRFLFHLRDKSFLMTTGATLVRYEQPSEGSASPPCSVSPKTDFFHSLHKDIILKGTLRQKNPIFMLLFFIYA